MDKITVHDVSHGVERLAKHYPRIQLQVGSPTNGRAWRLFIEEENGGLSNFPGLPGDGYLGWTTREAYQTIRGIEAGMEAQRLIQAEGVRFAAHRLRRQRPMQSGQAAALDARAVEALDELAPPTEF